MARQQKLRARRRRRLLVKIKNAIMTKYAYKSKRFFDQWKKITKLKNIQRHQSLQRMQRSEVMAAILS